MYVYPIKNNLYFTFYLVLARLIPSFECLSLLHVCSVPNVYDAHLTTDLLLLLLMVQKVPTPFHGAYKCENENAVD